MVNYHEGIDGGTEAILIHVITKAGGGECLWQLSGGVDEFPGIQLVDDDQYIL